MFSKEKRNHHGKGGFVVTNLMVGSNVGHFISLARWSLGYAVICDIICLLDEFVWTT